MQHLQTLRDEALRHLAAAGDGDTLEAWRIQYLGRKGAVLELLRGFRTCRPASGRPLARRPTRSSKSHDGL